jgi:arginine/lysine/ornithine decarboxylase
MALSLPEPVRFGYGPNESREVLLEHSIGETAAEWVIPYPPGIPMLFPGETITESTVDQLIRWRHEGARIQGAKDPGLRTIRIQSGSANEG